jgi:hypothetical protein
MDGMRFVLFFRSMTRFALLGEAVADLLLCGIQWINCMTGSIPPMRLYSPPRVRMQMKFWYFLGNFPMGTR